MRITTHAAHQASPNRVRNDVTCCCDDILVCSQGSIVEASLPYRILAARDAASEPVRHASLECLDDLGESPLLAYTEEPVDVIRHDHERQSPGCAPRLEISQAVHAKPCRPENVKITSPPGSYHGDEIDLVGLAVATFAKIFSVRFLHPTDFPEDALRLCTPESHINVGNRLQAGSYSDPVVIDFLAELL